MLFAITAVLGEMAPVPMMSVPLAVPSFMNLLPVVVVMIVVDGSPVCPARYGGIVHHRRRWRRCNIYRCNVSRCRNGVYESVAKHTRSKPCHEFLPSMVGPMTGVRHGRPEKDAQEDCSCNQLTVLLHFRSPSVGVDGSLVP